MRVSKDKAAENRERMLTEAARLFRERGPDGVGVDALTEAAGMTHGSLYSQFGSKDNLLAEALNHGYARIAARSVSIQDVTKALSLYLSTAHRDNPGSGCYMAALACDMSRQSKPVRTAFTEIVRDRIKRFRSLLSGHSRSLNESEDAALAMVCGMVGAMVLARAVNDAEVSDRILDVSRKQLLKDSFPPS